MNPDFYLYSVGKWKKVGEFFIIFFIIGYFFDFWQLKRHHLLCLLLIHFEARLLYHDNRGESITYSLIWIQPLAVSACFCAKKARSHELALKSFDLQIGFDLLCLLRENRTSPCRN